MRARRIILAATLALLPAGRLVARQREHKVTKANVEVTYEQIGREYAQAVADICQNARDALNRRFGCDMPQRLTVRMQTGWAGEPLLFSNGRDEIVLRLETGGQLKGYADNGVHFVYGLCRESARIAMERTLPVAPWLSSTGREGWCHYAGSVVLNDIVAVRGARVWPKHTDDYLDGLSRLRNQLDQRDSPPVVRAAGAWQALADLCRGERMGRVFKAWSKLPDEAPDPGQALAATLGNARLESWFAKMRDHFIDSAASRLETTMVPAEDLTGHAVVLHFDDGKHDGSKRIGGQGHAMRFEAPAGEWYLRVVRVYARRESPLSLNRDEITMWLCDERMTVLGEFRQRGKQLRPGGARWHRIGTPPVRVPRRFVICVRFGEGPRGEVAVYYGSKSQGHALIGLPGKQPQPFADGDWMIRVELDRIKAHDPLRPQVKPPSLVEITGKKMKPEQASTVRPVTPDGSRNSSRNR